jgi:phosphoenolpyruvate synthase/pyruvate phosphate dikinase
MIASFLMHLEFFIDRKNFHSETVVGGNKYTSMFESNKFKDVCIRILNSKRLHGKETKLIKTNDVSWLRTKDFPRMLNHF